MLSSLVERRHMERLVALLIFSTAPLSCGGKASKQLNAAGSGGVRMTDENEASNSGGTTIGGSGGEGSSSGTNGDGGTGAVPETPKSNPCLSEADVDVCENVRP